MNLPYSADVLYSFLAGYNAALWPAQILAYLLALAALILALRPVAQGGRSVSLLLAAGWVCCGLVFHLQHFQSINFFALYFAPVFLLQALLLLWTGALRGKLTFAFRRDRSGARGLVLVGTALILVPLLGWLGVTGSQARPSSASPRPRHSFSPSACCCLPRGRCRCTCCRCR